METAPLSNTLPDISHSAQTNQKVVSSQPALPLSGALPDALPSPLEPKPHLSAKESVAEAMLTMKSFLDGALELAKAP